MFPGTHFSPPHFYYEIKATTVPESSGGDSNYGAKTPVISGIAKFHWRRDYATGSTWTRTSFPGWESPDSYASEGYDNWADNTLRQKFIGDSVSAVTSPGVYVINIPSDVAMGTKEHTYNVFNGYWIPEPAVLTGEFPYGSTVIIHNHGIIAGSGGLAGRGGAFYNHATVSKNAIGGGGGGGSGLQDWDLPVDAHEQGDNWGPYPLDSNKTSPGGELPDFPFSGSAGCSSLGLADMSVSETRAANGVFGEGNLVSTTSADGSAGTNAPDGVTSSGSTATHVPTNGQYGGHGIGTTSKKQIIQIYNHSTGKIYGGGGGGGGGVAVADIGTAGGDGGVLGGAGQAGTSGGGSSGGAAGAAGECLYHHSFWDQADSDQSKYIIKLQAGTMKGSDGDSSSDSNFDAGTEH